MSLETVLVEMATKLQKLSRDVSDLQRMPTGSIWTMGAQPLVIDAGVVTISASSLYYILPETGTTDNLNTINGGRAGKVICLRTTDGNTIILKHGTGDISLTGGVDQTLDDIRLFSMLVFDDNQDVWIPMSYCDVSELYVPSVPTEVAGRINLGSIQAVTLSGNSFALVADKSFYDVHPEEGAADDLENITGGTDGDLIVLRPSGGAEITTRETGNLKTDDGDHLLDGTADKMTLIYDNDISKWCEINWAGN